jgi:polar amino acid transport system permease protein
VNGDRRSRILGGRYEGAKSLSVAVASTLIFFGFAALLVVRSPGWPEVKRTFFDWDVLRDSFPEIAQAFRTNVKIFLIAEAIVLVAALVIAVMRSLQGPVFLPLRILAIMYTDFFRGIPAILLIYLLGFGAPALEISGVPDSPFFWGVVSLSLIYTAYVSEVYRAGIESVHPSQDAAARSLGLSRLQSLRHVVLPQAVRRVLPPLLNDFIGLQKDSALVATIGVVEVLRQSQIESSAIFNFTPFVATAILFLAITIPLTRFTDWLILRDRRRREASGVTT